MIEHLRVIADKPSDEILIALLRADLATITKKNYLTAMMSFIAQGGNLFDGDQLATYCKWLGRQKRVMLDAAVTLCARELAKGVRAIDTSESIAQTVIHRLEQLEDAVRLSIETYIPLTKDEVKALMATCDDTINGLRDRVVIGLLVGAGLRRMEAVNLTFDDVTQVDGRTWLTIRGKGAENRTIPISDSLANIIAQWSEAAGINTGRILRSFVHKHRDDLRDDTTRNTLFAIVRAHGEMIGKHDLTPDELRTAYAQIGYDSGIPITEISRLLGDATVLTTQTYLRLEVDTEKTISDYVPI